MKKLFTFILLSLSFLASSQNPGDLAQSFGVSPGFSSRVNTTSVQADGKILVGGIFTSYNGVTENRIIRLNTDGSKDTSFSTGTGFNGTVWLMAVQTDGKILVGGDFTSYNGVIEKYIIRLNADGSKDTSFSTGTGFNNTVYSIALQADGKILVGGGFTSYNGLTEKYIIRLNANGSKDTSFSTGTGFNGSVNTIAVQADGKILLGGGFYGYNGLTENNIIRLNANGSKDTSFSTGTGFNGVVNTIVLQADGKILVGGGFTTYNGLTENFIIRLNANGSKDTSFSTGTGFNSIVYTIALQSDGKILLGGVFISYKGLTENRIIRLNADGSKDTSFSTGTGFDHYAYTIALQADGKILVVGSFTAYKGFTENSIIRLNTDGSKDTSFSTGTGFNGVVNTIVLQADGKILVGGAFTNYNGLTENYIIRLNTNGSKDTSFSTGTGFSGTVTSMALQADGKILIVGSFTSYKGVTENRIIRLNTDGSKDTSFNTGTGFDNYGFTITLQADGKILVGGIFSSYKGVSENRIIRLNTDGSKDTSFSTGIGFNNLVTTIALQTDGKILVGGLFTNYKGVTENRIIRLNTDGSKDTSFSTGTGFNERVYTIALQADGKILVGGGFSTYNGVTENYIIRLNADGSKDTSFNTETGFNNYVNTITLQADGKILVAGSFTSYKGVTEKYIIRLNANGSKDTSFSTGTGLNNSVETIALQNGNKILVGGGFITYKGNNSSAYLIGLHTTAPTLGTERFDTANSFVVYPNPVKDVLYFQSNDLSSLKNIKIYDFQGKLVLEDTKENISVRSLSNGLYVAKITTDKGEITRKFVKE